MKINTDVFLVSGSQREMFVTRQTEVADTTNSFMCSGYANNTVVGGKKANKPPRFSCSSCLQ